MLRRRLRPLTVMTIVAVATAIIAGCGTNVWGRSGIEGYWKGQMIEESTTSQGRTLNSRSKGRPRRILLELEEDAGVVQGRFAQSYDMIAFRQIDDENSRQVSTYPVIGTLDGTQLRLSFTIEAGGICDIDAVAGERMIVGTYVVHGSTGDSGETQSGRFEIERY